ncbi:MAG: PEP-CTERM sorting domain-containing protein [Candidatus Thiodiazotropha sp.]|nr:PEP-CTERM sorting domain-containing protein [Candidatus Thiodiazotropha taylori]MBT3060941.1 PEP-CTERM sorting domain-containing protein [Candidatus Thiodiazotropha sp. (ex Lucina pensylvanica)]PUB79761.1 MAG: hypothetical protein DBO99_02825 [gamma proteobacterium symbiont of Ctena orbiculata]
MMMKLVRFFLVAMMGISANSYAAMVTENWAGYVSYTSSNVDSFTNGERLTWSVTYDNALYTANKYLDSDGSVVETLNGTPFDGTSGHQYFSNATFSFGDIFTRLLDGDTVNDHANTNWGFTYNYTFYTGASASVQSFQGLDSSHFSLNNSRGNFDIYGINTGFRQVSIDSAAKISPSPVPVPAAVWLFGTGLLGLLGFNRRKNKA